MPIDCAGSSASSHGNAAPNSKSDTSDGRSCSQPPQYAPPCNNLHAGQVPQGPIYPPTGYNAQVDMAIRIALLEKDLEFVRIQKNEVEVAMRQLLHLTTAQTGNTFENEAHRHQHATLQAQLAGANFTIATLNEQLKQANSLVLTLSQSIVAMSRNQHDDATKPDQYQNTRTGTDIGTSTGTGNGTGIATDTEAYSSDESEQSDEEGLVADNNVASAYTSCSSDMSESYIHRYGNLKADTKKDLLQAGAVRWQCPVCSIR